jgi:hypothetical protein
MSGTTTAPTDELTITVQHWEGVTDVIVRGPMDASSTPKIAAAVREVTRPDLQRVTLDLSGVTAINLAVIAYFIEHVATLVRFKLLIDIVPPDDVEARSVVDMTGIVPLCVGLGV